jgi:hypothetical protein
MKTRLLNQKSRTKCLSKTDGHFLKYSVYYYSQSGILAFENSIDLTELVLFVEGTSFTIFFTDKPSFDVLTKNQFRFAWRYLTSKSTPEGLSYPISVIAEELNAY